MGKSKERKKWSVSYHLRKRMRDRGGSENLIMELLIQVH